MNPNETNLVFSKKRILIYSLLLLPFIFLLIFSIFYFFMGSNGVKDVSITNISGNSATITWSTKKETKGKVIFSEESSFPFYSPFYRGNKKIAFDDRDINFNQNTAVAEYSKEIAKGRITHHVTLRNLKENTNYNFRIVDNFKLFSGETTSFKTFGTIDGVNIPDTIYGNVLNNKDEPIKDGIVFFRVVPRAGDKIYNNSNLYSSVLNEEGGWSGDLSILLNFFGAYLNIGMDARDIEIFVITNEGNKEKIRLPLNQYKPLEDLIIN